MKLIWNSDINRGEWCSLVQASSNGTWFQTPEAYAFFASMPDIFQPFVVGVERVNELGHEGVSELVGVCVGYVTKEKSAVKQFFTRRAIIIGGPALADDAMEEEVIALMAAIKNLSFTHSLIHSFIQSPIYIETRNLNDYSRWKEAFEKAGFAYCPHLNFHVHTDRPWTEIEEQIGKHRRKYIRLSLREGATIETQPEIEQVKAYYALLQNLYRTKVKTPLLPWSFFERLYHLDSCRYLLVVYNGQVAGGSVCMVLPGKGVYEWYACGMDGEYKNLYPSSVTKYAGMRYAYDTNCAVFDMMGAGKPDEEYGVRDFKAEFGGEKVEHGRFVCVLRPLLYRLGTFVVQVIMKVKN